ncbi:MAG TPA: TraR/DksA C4-type zinc finger protein [Gaiellaceae bacterium]
MSKTIGTKRFRATLIEERERVERVITNLRDEHPGTADDEVEDVSGPSDNHIAETATATLDREIDFTLEENSGQVLVEIDAALKRIDDGTYGTCTNCGKEIAQERLEAHPWAALCIDCAKQAEHR